MNVLKAADGRRVLDQAMIRKGEDVELVLCKTDQPARMVSHLDEAAILDLFVTSSSMPKQPLN